MVPIFAFAETIAHNIAIQGIPLSILDVCACADVLNLSGDTRPALRIEHAGKNIMDQKHKLRLSLAASELGKRGARARNKNLSPQRRHEIAQCAAIARWRRVAKDTPRLSDETPPKDIP